MKISILLLSSSYVHGTGFLEAHKAQIEQLTNRCSRLLFIPFAADRNDWESYTEKTQTFFQQLNITVTGAHTHVLTSLQLHEHFDAIFIGGGNTFRLLQELQERDMIGQIRDAVNKHEVKYMGSSAGINVAGPTICTTNDMPIVYPEGGFSALGLVPFQLNPHYLDPDPTSKHMGETREQRIKEYHQANDRPVVGLREGSYLLITGNSGEDFHFLLGGSPGARLFRKGMEAIELTPEAGFTLK